MKKLVTYALLTCFVSLTVFADVKISDLPAGTALGGTEAIPVVQSATTVKTTPSAINTYVQSQTTSATVIGKFTSCSGTKYLGADGACHAASTGSVTSVDLTVPSGFSVTGAPITTSGTLGITGVLNPVAGGTGAATLSGILKGNGTAAIGPAASSDVIGLWSGTCDLTTFLRGDGTCALASNGTVTSVALTAPSVFSVSGSPVTTSGTFGLTFASGQSQNEVLASPNGSSGAVSLRSLVAADLPSISSGLSGILPASNGGTGNGFFAVSGPSTSTKTFTFPNASSTVLTSNAAVTVAQGGTGAATLSGVLKGNGTAAIGSAASSDVIGLWSGSCDLTTFLRGDGSCAAASTTTTLTGDVTGSGVGSIATTLASSLAGGHTFTGVVTFANEVDFIGNSSLTIGQHSPSDLSAGNNNNYNLGSFGAGVGRNYRLTANASGSTITGIALSASGFWSLQFFNVGTTGDITLTNEDSASTSDNRILTPNGANVVIQPGGAVELWYDGTGVSRWRVVRTLANAVNLAASGAGGVTGTLPVSNGGIGAATLTGIAKGNGTSAFTAAASSDVIGLWSGSCSSGTFLRGDGSCAAAGAGSVTSVALTAPSVFSVSGSPVTSSGTLGVTFATGQTQNQVLASPDGSSGAVALRALVAADLPSISSGLTGTLPAGNGGTSNGFFAVSGPATSTKTFTFPDASSTVLTSNALVTAAQGGTNNGFFAVSGPATSTKTFTFPNASATVLTSNALVTAAQGGTNNGFFAVSGPTTSTKTFTFPDASSTVLTSNAAVTVAQGGTGVGTLTSHGVLLGAGTSNVTAVAAMAADTLLQGQGVSSDPAAVSVTNCGDSTHALAYSTSTHTFSCQAITGSTASGSLLNIRVLSGSGTYTPTSGAHSIWVVAIGGGGGSGGILHSAAKQAIGSGGGAGGASYKYITSIAASYSYVVGAAGTAGASGNNAGGSGGSTTFGSTILSAPGGNGAQGVSEASATYGVPGNATAVATGGDVNTAGAAGNVGAYDAVNSNAISSGAGASGPYGTGGAIRTGNGDGQAATGFGAGAGGPMDFSGTTDRAGAAGTAGTIIVWEFT